MIAGKSLWSRNGGYILGLFTRSKGQKHTYSIRRRRLSLLLSISIDPYPKDDPFNDKKRDERIEEGPTLVARSCFYAEKEPYHKGEEIGEDRNKEAFGLRQEGVIDQKAFDEGSHKLVEIEGRYIKGEWVLDENEAVH